MSPIKALMPENNDPSRGLPRIAKLYKGDEKPAQGNRPGKDLNHFRVEFEPAYEHLREWWIETFKETPTEFKGVLLAGNTPDEVFPYWLEEWNSNTLLHRCDGESQVQYWDKRAAKYDRTPISCERALGGQCGCKETGRINLILPELTDLGYFGYVALNTHSKHDILTLTARLGLAYRMTGGLWGVPFTIGRSVQEKSAPEYKDGKPTGKRITTKKSLLYLDIDPEFTRNRILPALANAARMNAAATAGELPATIQDEFEDEVIAEKQTPENNALMRHQGKPRRIGAPASEVVEVPAVMVDTAQPGEESAAVIVTTEGEIVEYDTKSNPAPTPADAPSWATYDQEWTQVVEFAKGFKYTDSDVLFALNTIAERDGGKVNGRADVTCSKIEALAGVIAMAMEFNPDKVISHITKRNGSAELLEAAKRIVEHMNRDAA